MNVRMVPPSIPQMHQQATNSYKYTNTVRNQPTIVPGAAVANAAVVPTAGELAYK